MRNRAAAALFCSIVPFTATGAEQITLVAFGDSLTQGFGLPEEEGFVPVLERWLESEGGQGDLTLINAGVSGDTTAGGKARIAWTLSEDVDAVVLNLGANDMLRGLDPSASRANLEAMIAEITARNLPLLITHVPAPSNFGAEYKQEFDAIYPELAEANGALYHSNFFAGLDAPDLLSAQKWMQADGLHPNAEGVQRIVAEIGPSIVELLERVAN